MILKKIQDLVEEGWQVQSVWIVPPTSSVSRSGQKWEAHIKIAGFVPLGEGGSELSITIDRKKIPQGVSVTAREKVADQVIDLPAMSDEQAEAMAQAIAKKGDATGVQKTSSDCWAIGPCANWVRDPLRTAILNSRKPARPRGRPVSETETASAHLHLRCEPSRKARYVKAAQRAGQSLSEWSLEMLDQASAEAR